MDDNGTQLYHMDPSGTYLQFDAKAIGSGSEGAQQSLQEVRISGNFIFLIPTYPTIRLTTRAWPWRRLPSRPSPSWSRFPLLTLMMNCKNNVPTIVVVFYQRTFAAHLYLPPSCRLWKRSWTRQTWKQQQWHQRVGSGLSRGRSSSPSSRSWPESKYVLLLTSNDNSFVPANSFYHTGSFLLCMQWLYLNQFLTHGWTFLIKQKVFLARINWW